MKLYALLLSLLATPAHATLWELTLEGNINYQGTVGRESVVYRWDTDNVTYTSVCSPFGCGHGPEQTLTGVIDSITWSGLVDGSRTLAPMHGYAIDSWTADRAYLGGTLFIGGQGMQGYADPLFRFPFVVLSQTLFDMREPETSQYRFTGGEADWTWDHSHPVNQLPYTISWTYTQIPEPSPLFLLLGLLPLVALRRNAQWLALR